MFFGCLRRQCVAVSDTAAWGHLFIVPASAEDSACGFASIPPASTWRVPEALDLTTSGFSFCMVVDAG